MDGVNSILISYTCYYNFIINCSSPQTVSGGRQLPAVLPASRALGQELRGVQRRDVPAADHQVHLHRYREVGGALYNIPMILRPATSFNTFYQLATSIMEIAAAMGMSRMVHVRQLLLHSRGGVDLHPLDAVVVAALPSPCDHKLTILRHLEAAGLTEI